MQKNQLLFGCGVILASMALLAVVTVLAGALLAGAGKTRKPCIGVVNVSGVIQSGGGQGGLFAEASAGSGSVVNALKRGAEDKNIKAIVIRINSPGGTAAASQEMFFQVMKMRGGKPIIVSMGDVAASGGYYVAAAADTIFANPATLTGSIGVRMGWINFKDLLEKYGVKGVTIKAGKYKDMGSPFRDLTKEEEKIFTRSVDNIHNQFIRYVASGRKMKIEAVRKLATGEIFTGEQALSNGLVDRIGGYEDALSFAARKAKLKGDPEVRDLGRERMFPLNLQTRAAMPSPLNETQIYNMGSSLLLVPQLAPQ
jgi:protease-4